MTPNPYDKIPTEQDKKRKRQAMHKNRPDLGAVNDKRKKKPPREGPGDPTPEEINARLEAKEREGLVNISQLSDKYGIDPKKVRAIIRDLGYNAPPVTEKQPNNFGPRTRYEFEQDSKQLAEIEAALKKQAK